MQRDRVVETRDQGQVVKGLDARFRGHDGAGISDFMRKLPGLIPERRARAALRGCLGGKFALAITFQKPIH